MKSQIVENLKAPFQLKALYFQGVSSDSEVQEFAMQIYVTWLARAALRQAGIEANTSHAAEYSAQPALISDPNNCTVGVPSSCNTGGSNK